MNNNLDNSDLVKAEIFSNLSPEVVVESINNQINTVFGENIVMNQLELFDEKIIDLRNNNEEDPEFMDDIFQLESNVYTGVLNKIENIFSISLDIDNTNFIDSVKVLYNFFIYNYRINLTNFIVGYILKNRKFYHSEYKDITEKKDIRISQGRRDFKDTKDAYIIANIYTIIESLTSNIYIDDESIFKYMNACEETPIVSDMNRLVCRNGTLTSNSGELYSDFIAPFTEQYGYNIGTIANDVVEVLYDRFPKNI